MTHYAAAELIAVLPDGTDILEILHAAVCDDGEVGHSGDCPVEHLATTGVDTNDKAWNWLHPQ